MPKAKKVVKPVVSSVDVRGVLSRIVDVLDSFCPRESVNAARTAKARADLREEIAAL